MMKDIHSVKSGGNKHAFLIMAHSCDLCFCTLITMLDDPRNDLYIHMDSKCMDYDKKVVSDLVKQSSVFFVKRRNCTWGGESLMRVEISLLKAAVKRGPYHYYHLLSGQDLPIKTQDAIHAFFDRNGGKEFVCFTSEEFKAEDRVRQYHFFQEKLGRKYWESRWNVRILKKQERMGVWRHKKVSFQYGDQWFSITDAFARYIVSHKRWLKRIFRFSLCCDELFVQTLLLKSPYMGNRFREEMDDDKHAIMRLIDWKRGKPYVFRSEDYEELTASDMLFARKFDSALDPGIIERVRDYVSSSR